MKILAFLFLGCLSLFFNYCKNDNNQDTNSGKITSQNNEMKSEEPRKQTNEYIAKVVKTFSHDKDAFTQGLFFHNEYLYESTGLKGKSSLRKVELETGKVIKSIKINSDYFSEGITLFKNKIFMLTWISNTCLVFDFDTFKEIKTFKYQGQGWGITTVDSLLVMSDGSNVLRFLNPDDFSVKKLLPVIDEFYNPVHFLNELEFINGEIWANVWNTNYIVRIDPKTGVVKSKIDLSPLWNLLTDSEGIDVLNGIAYDDHNNKLYVTGKNWPFIFEIVLEMK